VTDSLRERLASALGSDLELLDELRGGGMSRVFVARDLALDRRVVVKVLAPDRAGVLSVERFRNEALFAASLQHPHIVPIISIGAVDGVPFLVMPFIEGRSLRDRLEREGPLPIRDAVRILLDVSRACAYAHSRGIIHRDIKPDNILVSGDAAIIADFGIARAVAAGGASVTDTRLTQRGFTVGSPRYMAPEQATGDEDVDHRADIYSFGIVAYELLAGVPPFDAVSSSELLRAHLTTPPPDLRTARPDTPESLADLVSWCLSKRREDRPADASVIVAALEAAGVSAPSRSRQTSSRRPFARRWIRIPGAVLVIIGGLMLAWRSRAPHGSAQRDSVAVLPVIDRTGDSTSEWLATGLTDEVTALLGRVPGLRVAARRTVERFRSDTASTRQIARALGVAALLDATLTRTATDSFALAAQLIDGRSGLVLWSASLHCSRGDVVALQDSVVAGVLAGFGRSSDTAPATLPLEDPVARRTAWVEYLRGRQELRRRGKTHLFNAIDDFNAAIRVDAMLAQAYAGLADSWSLLPLYDPAAGPQPLSRALDAVDRALALDPRSPEARASRGHILVGLWQWKEAEADLRAALATNGALIDARQWLGELLMLTGRDAEAVREILAARALDPTSPVLVAIHGFALGMHGQYADGIAAVNTALRLDESFVEADIFGGAVELLAGRPDAALVFLRRGVALAPTNPFLVGLYGQASALAGDTAAAHGALRQLDGLASGIPRNSARAHVHLGLGDTTAAFAALEQAVVEREPIFAAEPLGTSLFAAIRRTAHFAGLLGEMGFDAETAARIRASR
jgi:eukaryotic-like serine/threonine-protein kinase